MVVHARVYLVVVAVNTSHSWFLFRARFCLNTHHATLASRIIIIQILFLAHLLAILDAKGDANQDAATANRGHDNDDDSTA